MTSKEHGVVSNGDCILPQAHVIDAKTRPSGEYHPASTPATPAVVESNIYQRAADYTDALDNGFDVILEELVTLG